MELQHHTIGVFTKLNLFILSVQLDLKLDSLGFRKTWYS